MQPLLPTGTNGTSAGPSSAGAGTGGESAEEPPSKTPSSSLGKKEKKPRLSASDKHALKRLWRETVSPEKDYMTAGVLAMFVSSATNMAFPRLVGQIMDRTTKAAAEKDKGGGEGAGEASSSPSSSLQAFVARALLIFLAGAVGSCVRTHCLRMAKEGTARRLRKKLLRSLLAQVSGLVGWWTGESGGTLLICTDSSFPHHTYHTPTHRRRPSSTTRRAARTARGSWRR